MLVSKPGYFEDHKTVGNQHNTSKDIPKMRTERTLTVVYQNVRGLNTKLKFFRLNMLSLECDIVAVTESFLTDAIEDSELLCGDWTVLRRDRATGSRGGGVLLTARPGLDMRRRRELETQNGEDMWVSFALEGIIYNLCVVYIPPSASDDVYMCWFQKVEQVLESVTGVILIVGDLNLNPLYTSHHILCYYSYFLTICGMREMNEVTNASGGILDVVLVSERIHGVCVSEIEGGGLVPRRDAYHPPLDITLPIQSLMRSPSAKIDPSNVDSRCDWNFAKGDYVLLYQLLTEASWQKVFDAEDVNVAVDMFYNQIYNIFDECIPKRIRSKRVGRRFPIWFTADIIADLALKASLHQKWKRTKCREVYRQFAELRTDTKERISVAYNCYMDRIQSRIKSDPRSFWQHIDSLRSKGGFASEVSFEGKQFFGVEAASAFSRYFSSVFLPGVPQLDVNSVKKSKQKSTAQFIHIGCISMQEVETAIKRLKPKSSVGPDTLPAYIVKGCVEQLKVPIHFLFNLSLSTGIYPQFWKITRVSPIPKSKDNSKVENYRPIAVLSTLGKLFESILFRAISTQVKPFLCESQHGFRAGRSVDTNLLILTDTISECLDEGIQVDVIYFDFKKAFDRVDNDILLDKLDDIGFSPMMLAFFASYLRDRQQYVRYGCFISDRYRTRSGVSQGSILGPLLFGLMVNDLESVVRNAKCLLYADDLKLIHKVRDAADCVSLQEDIVSVLKWSIDNKLSFNIAKCCVCTFGRSFSPMHAQYFLGNDVLNRVFSVKDLGVVFDTRLTFHEHIRALACSCYKRLGFVLRNSKDFQEPTVIQLLFNALVRSKLEASSLIWNPYESTYALLLEKIQKSFLRFLYKKRFGYYPYLYPTKFLLGCLGVNSLEVRRTNNLLITVCRFLRGESDVMQLVHNALRLSVPDVPRVALRPRARALLAVPAARTRSRRSAPLPRALALLNTLLASAPECDLFAWRWVAVCRECLNFSEMMDDRQSTVH